MARIVFYCRDQRSNVDTFEYYRQDIEALESLGHTVIVCTRYRDIPVSFDAMFVWWWTYALVPSLICRVWGKPCVITGVFNFRFPEHLKGIDYFARPWWQRALISAATKIADLNLFLNEHELHLCSEFFGLTSGRYYPCSVHDDYLRGPAASRETSLFNIAWSGKGNLVRKGIPVLLDAVRVLKDDGITVRLVLAGHPGDGTDYLLRRVAELGIDDRVTWLGSLSRERKIELLRYHEIYVQPSLYEGFGLATAEAMGCGACVIVCDVGAVRSVVGDAGVYVAPGSATELARAISHVLTHRDVREQFQRAAHDRARSEFDAVRKRERLRRYLREIGIG